LEKIWLIETTFAKVSVPKTIITLSNLAHKTLNNGSLYLRQLGNVGSGIVALWNSNSISLKFSINLISLQSIWPILTLKYAPPYPNQPIAVIKTIWIEFRAQPKQETKKEKLRLWLMFLLLKNTREKRARGFSKSKNWQKNNKI
jgi:hypothetical protein